MKTDGAPHKIADAIDKIYCGSCPEAQRPATVRSATLTSSEFNETVYLGEAELILFDGILMVTMDDASSSRVFLPS